MRVGCKNSKLHLIPNTRLKLDLEATGQREDAFSSQLDGLLANEVLGYVGGVLSSEGGILFLKDDDLSQQCSVFIFQPDQRVNTWAWMVLAVIHLGLLSPGG